MRRTMFSKSWSALGKDELSLPVIERILSQHCVPAVVFKDCEPHSHLLYLSKHTISPHILPEALDNPFIHALSLDHFVMSCLNGESDNFDTKLQQELGFRTLDFMLTMQININDDNLFKSYFMNHSFMTSTSCPSLAFPNPIKVKMQVTSVENKTTSSQKTVTTADGEHPIFSIFVVAGYADPQTRKLVTLPKTEFQGAAYVPSRVHRPPRMGDVTCIEVQVQQVHIDHNSHANVSFYFDVIYTAVQKRIKDNGMAALTFKSMTISFVNEVFLGDRVECVASDVGLHEGPMREFGAFVFKREGLNTTPECANAKVMVEVEQGKYYTRGQVNVEQAKY